jgi:hypothetical protein
MTSIDTTSTHGIAQHAYLQKITIAQLADLCDDPKRDEPGSQEVYAILTFDEANGFFLSARDGETVYAIYQQNGEPVKFRTAEQAIRELIDIPYLCHEVRLDILTQGKK